MSKLFTDEEVYDFTTKIMTDSSSEKFGEFYDRCLRRAKQSATVSQNMVGSALMHFIAKLNIPLWGETTIPDAKQIALIELTDAMAQELFDMLPADLEAKEKEKLPN